MPLRFKVAIGVVLLAAFFIAAAGWNLLTRIDTTSQRNAAAAQATACSNRLISDFAAAAGRALAAPPAPNPERLAATTDILRAADRLARSDSVCAHGIPKPLVPTRAKAG